MASSQFKPVKYVIFDMDGLLLNTEKIYFDTFKKVLSRYGKTYTEDMRVKVMGTVPRDTYSIFIKEYELPVELDNFYKEISSELIQVMDKADLMPGVERLLNHLKSNNIPIAVGTSSSQEAFDVKTKNHAEIFKLFHHIVVGSSDPEVKQGKPAPDVFLVCASRFPEKPAPSECLVFEDAPNGVQAAISAGMQCVMVPDSVVPEEKRKLATRVIDSLLDFKPEEFGLPKFS
ncbi:probable pseudouridine-5'-phosphatase [Planococcus citri]|uniref:probable pseudouridine-5'-phosphatase n=1 Tax=Planococcus citri TaxID=170843 RepID=UPI0031F91591